jgi:hypothetical protein
MSFVRTVAGDIPPAELDVCYVERPLALKIARSGQQIVDAAMRSARLKKTVPLLD